MKSKQLITMIIVSFLISISAFAQKDSSGIYKTASDFEHGKLSYAINYKTEKHKINGDMFFNDKEINVKHAGKKYTLQKSETYGYRSTKGEDFRFINNKTYKILNAGEPLLIYVYKHPSHSPKEAEKYHPMYYFSPDASAALQDLTKANLKAAFPNNHKFHDALDAQFREDNELNSYDSYHKMYKVNRLLQNSTK
jgi:hypothetical protein